MATMTKRRRRGKLRAVLPSGRDIPPSAARIELLERVHRDWKVVGTYFGFKRVRNRWTRVPSLVCLVESKPKQGRRTGRKTLVPPAERIPASVSWIERRRTFAIPTDVVASTGEVQLQQGPIVGPGDTARFGSGFATVGAIVDHPSFGRCATTAGHLFGGPVAIGRPTQLTSGNQVIPAIVRQCVLQHAIDYALMSPAVHCDIDNLFQDRARIGPVFIPTVADLNKRVFVLQGAGAVPTVVRGIHARLNTALGVFDDVILADAVTRPGMSGAALVDTASRLWGFLLGTLGRFSFFMPAPQLLLREFSALA